MVRHHHGREDNEVLHPLLKMPLGVLVVLGRLERLVIGHLLIVVRRDNVGGHECCGLGSRRRGDVLLLLVLVLVVRRVRVREVRECTVVQGRVDVVVIGARPPRLVLPLEEDPLEGLRVVGGIMAVCRCISA
jgi:hypothetical protein